MAAKRKPPKSVLQEVFLNRVQAVMDEQHLTRNQVAARVGGPSQTTFNDVMNGSDPTLKTVHQIATALGVPAWRLLTYAEQRHHGSVTKFPETPVLGLKDKRTADRKKRQA